MLEYIPSNVEISKNFLQYFGVFQGNWELETALGFAYSYLKLYCFSRISK